MLFRVFVCPFFIGNPHLIATWSIWPLTWNWVVNNKRHERGEKMQECYTDIHSIINGNLNWTGGKTKFKKKDAVDRPPTAPHRPHTNNEDEDPTPIYSSNFQNARQSGKCGKFKLYSMRSLLTPCVRCIFRPRPLTNNRAFVVCWASPLLDWDNSENFRPNCVASPRCVLKRSENRTVSRPLEHGTLFWILGLSPRVPFLV